MEPLRSFIRKQLLISENLQLADKIYFNTGKLSSEDKQNILNITNGDNSTKLIADLYFQIKQEHSNNINSWLKDLVNVHEQVINYNKNVFPIYDFDIYNRNNKASMLLFKMRGEILEDIKQLPSVALRNMKAEIRDVRGQAEFAQYKHKLEYFLAQYSLLSNRDPELRKAIERKMFRANVTLDDLINFAEEKENLLGGVKFTRKSINQIIEDDYSRQLEIVYEKGNIMVVEVVGPTGMNKIGTNSLWCFSYGKGTNWQTFNEYSTNGIVYVIIDFSQPTDSVDFMHTLIKPLTYDETEFESEDENDENDEKLYGMDNEPSLNPVGFVEETIGIQNAKRIFTFGEDHNEDLDSSYFQANSNQISSMVAENTQKKKLNFLYLNGLDSNPTKDKAGLFGRANTQVIAAKINYRTGSKFNQLCAIIEENKFDGIIGHSMGGYLAYYLANKYNIPFLIFNPAFKQKDMDLQPIPNTAKNNAPNKLSIAVVGLKDSDVPAELQLKHLKNCQVFKEKDMDHDIPNNIKVKYAKKFAQQFI